MEKMIWTEDMALGHAELDSAHHQLMAGINVLLGGPDSELEAGMPQLIDAFETDFRREEAMMEAINFPGLKLHREQHARVLATLHHLHPGDVGAMRTALVLLPQWFSVHVATLDTALAVALDTTAPPDPGAQGG